MNWFGGIVAFGIALLGVVLAVVALGILYIAYRLQDRAEAQAKKLEADLAEERRFRELFVDQDRVSWCLREAARQFVLACIEANSTFLDDSSPAATFDFARELERNHTAVDKARSTLELSWTVAEARGYQVGRVTDLIEGARTDAKLWLTAEMPAQGPN